MVAPAIADSADLEEISASAVSWPAILAGGAAAAAISLILLAFGAGVGFSSVSPWSSGGTMTAFSIGSGLYFIVMAMIASGIGGYLAGRLRTRWRSVQTREVFFRDTAHGLLAWAFATLLSAGLLGSAASSIVGGTTAAVSRLAGSSSEVLAGTVDRLLRAEPGTTRDTGALAASHNEADRILSDGLRRGGSLDAADRAYLAQLVATRTGINQTQAEQRVAAAIDQAKATLDAARKAAAQLALWLTASLLVGAFSAALAAIEGGGLRDGTWKYRV